MEKACVRLQRDQQRTQIRSLRTHRSPAYKQLEREGVQKKKTQIKNKQGVKHLPDAQREN